MARLGLAFQFSKLLQALIRIRSVPLNGPEYLRPTLHVHYQFGNGARLELVNECLLPLVMFWRRGTA